LTRHGIDESHVFDEAKVGFRWVSDYVMKHSSWPTGKMVEENIGSTLPDDLEPLNYVCELIRKRSLTLSLESDVRSAIKRIEDRDPDAALAILSDATLRLKAESKKEETVSYRKSGPERFKSYIDSKATKGLLGIPTPWKKLDIIIQGWVNGSLNVVAAMSNTGKSWFCCICAHDAELKGKKVLVVTLEMSSIRIERRIDAIRYKLPFGKLRDAELDAMREEDWKKRLEEAAVEKVESDILVVDKKTVRTVRDVYMLVKQHKPDIVIIDGGYRFEGDERYGQWAKTVSIVNDLQMFAEMSNVPWIVTTQFGDSEETGKEKKKGTKHVRAWNVRYGKEWFINPDILIGMYQDDDLRLIKRMEIHPLKVRDGDRAFDMFTIAWDMESMDFSEAGGGLFEVASSGSETEEGSHEITF